MTIGDMVRDEKPQCNIKREAAKVSSLSALSSKIYKYEYLTGDKLLPSNQRQIIEQGKFAYSLLGKAFEKQTEKQVSALKSLDLFNKKDELKQIEDVFPQNLMNDLVCTKLKEIINLQDIIKTDELHYKSKLRKIYNFIEYYLPTVF